MSKLRFSSLAACLAGVLAVVLGARASATPPARPYVVLVSFDGFRADYLDRLPLPNSRRLAASGVRARSMLPSFPSKTFPNHYTLRDRSASTDGS